MFWRGNRMGAECRSQARCRASQNTRRSKRAADERAAERQNPSLTSRRVYTLALAAQLPVVLVPAAFQVDATKIVASDLPPGAGRKRSAPPPEIEPPSEIGTE